MIKLSKNEALNYLEKGYVVIIRNKDFEDYHVIKQGEYLCKYDDCQVVNDVKTKNIVYMKMQSIIILCIFIIIHLLFSILSCSF